MNIFPTILTIIIAGIVAIISYLQWKTNSDKLRFELFEKRFKIYDDLRSVIANSGIKGKIGKEDLDQCKNIVREGCFLFDKEIEAFLNETYKKLIELDGMIEFGDNWERRIEIHTWMKEKLQQAEKDFDKYLRFK